MAPVLSSPDGKLPWWIYFVDLPEVVPFLAALGGITWLLKSPYAAAILKSYQLRFPDKQTRALEMMFETRGRIGSALLFGQIVLFTALDYFKWPKFLYQYKIQNKPAPSLAYTLKITAMSALELAFTSTLYKYLLFIPAYKLSGGIDRVDEIPTVSEGIKQIVIAEVFYQFWLYTTHWIMHQPSFYKWAHKDHHVHKTTFSAATLYSSIFERLFQSHISTSAPYFLGMHPFPTWIWQIHNSLGGVAAHCGYAFPFIQNALGHDFHHRSFTSYYGLYVGFPIFDWLFGTGKEYFAWRLEHFKTHHWITNLPLEGVSEEALKKLG